MNRNSLPVYIVAKTLRLALWPVAKLKYGKKQVWLISERGTDAEDNGYHMFRYLRKEHPEINVWYIISRDSKDLHKIEELGNIVYKGSFKHWMLFIIAKKFLVAFDPLVPSANKRFGREVIRRNDMKIIFLQHGIMTTDVQCYHRENAGYDLFICGAKPEYDYISEHFNYPEGRVRYTGLARFDALHDARTKRQIVIMPTWRKWIRDNEHEEPSESEYVSCWNSLLNNPRLSEIAARYDFEVYFYPHHVMQKHIALFSSNDSRVIIADRREYDVQTLLKESALLITDYSSVFFDFAYMKKPVIYYQFDDERVFADHTVRGYFDFDKMGFGPRLQREDKLLDAIEEYASGGFVLKADHEHRIEGFFPLHDMHNCERIYQAIADTFDK